PFVRGISFATSSIKSERSSPAERECTQRNSGHIKNTSRKSGSPPDQLKITSASGAAARNASGESPITTFSDSRNPARGASGGTSLPPRKSRMVVTVNAEFQLANFDCLQYTTPRARINVPFQSSRHAKRAEKFGRSHAK